MSLSRRDALLSRVLGQAWPHEPLLSALNLPGDLDVLDVGAGEGRLLHCLSRRGHTGKLSGLDPVPAQGVRRGVAEALPFKDASFDVVLMVRMLSHCLNPGQALAEARRILRPGGEPILAVQGRRHLQALWRQVGRPDPLRGAEDDVQDLLRGAGLPFRRQGVMLSLSLTLQDAVELLDTYAAESHLSGDSFPLADTLHLVIFRA